MLQTSFARGHADALARFGLKTAAGIPTARVVRPGSGVRSGVHSAGGATSLPPLPGLLSRAGSAAMGVVRPAAKVLGLGALGAAGVLGYGLHRAQQDDERRMRQIYAPMEGTYMG